MTIDPPRAGKLEESAYTNAQADDHNPPHFHAISAEDEIILVIADLSIYAGSLRSADLKLVRAWAAENRDAILAAWNRLNP